MNYNARKAMENRDRLRRELLADLLPGHRVPKNTEAACVLGMVDVDRASRYLRQTMDEMGFSHEWTGKFRVVVEAPIPGLF